MNRAARIAATGQGGQVLISDATRGLVEHALPDGVTIRHLGTHHLKDIEHPEPLHLIIDGLAVLAIREGNLDRGSRLAGASDRLIELVGGEAPPSVTFLDDPLEIVKGKLPQSRIDALWEEGRAMDPDDAIAFARRKA